MYLIASRFREAISSGERALAAFESLGNLWWAGRTLTHLNPAATALGEWDRSLNYCRRILEHAATLNDVRLRVIGLWRMGAAHITKAISNADYSAATKRSHLALFRSMPRWQKECAATVKSKQVGSMPVLRILQNQLLG